MIQCQNCGQVNSQVSNFCRFCGSKFLQSQYSNGNNYEYSPPRPYSWKTDEFQISESKARKSKTIERVQPLAHPTMPQPLAYQQPQNLTYGYGCPRCASQVIPRVERKISTAGWIVFAVLLITFFPLFWIGLLLKEDVRICPVCNLKID
jgi:RNA polymerase subunit RPABC4/transcription elongation factor Spt4